MVTEEFRSMHTAMTAIIPNLSVPQFHSDRPHAVWHLRAKRVMDVLFAGAGLCVLLPFGLVVAALIKCDSPGPVFFTQYRYGEGGRLFKILKFRSMRTDACSTTGGEQARHNDPRVTRMGRFMRRTSIDELPQLINVLRGDMALVGPRPHAVDHDMYYTHHIPFYAHRYTVRPGLTGWAQIQGLRGETKTLDEMRQRILYDLDYIRRQTILLDLRILLATVKVLLKSH